MVEIKHLCLCLLFSSTHFSVYKDTFAFYKDTKCVQGHAILMPDTVFDPSFTNLARVRLPLIPAGDLFSELELCYVLLPSIPAIER